MAAKPFPLRDLFGGAIVAYVPPAFEDASEFREIPDFQEVFIDATTDQSIIFELLKLDDDVKDQDAATHHFQELVVDNVSPVRSVRSVAPLAQSDIPRLPLNSQHQGYLLLGSQQSSKFNEAALNDVSVLLAVLRLRDVGTDAVISYNVPVRLAEESSSKSIERASEGNPDQAAEEFRRLVESFEVRDWGLFDDSDTAAC